MQNSKLAIAKILNIRSMAEDAYLGIQNSILKDSNELLSIAMSNLDRVIVQLEQFATDIDEEKL